MADTARENEILYVMPVAVYNAIMDKIQYLDSKLQRQTKSLMMHIKDKQEMAKKIKMQNSYLKIVNGEFELRQVECNNLNKKGGKK